MSANKSRFPAALQRHHGTSEPPPRRQGPSAADLAMMTSAELKVYYQKRGQWQSADLEAIAEARRQNDYTGRQYCPNKSKRW
jgi:hypothetical protein